MINYYNYIKKFFAGIFFKPELDKSEFKILKTPKRSPYDNLNKFNYFEDYDNKINHKDDDTYSLIEIENDVEYIIDMYKN